MRRHGGARGSARPAPADRDLRALVAERLSPRAARIAAPAAKGAPATSSSETAASSLQRAASRCRARSARRRRSGSAPPAAASAGRPARRRARRPAVSAATPRVERGEARRADQQAELQPQQHRRPAASSAPRRARRRASAAGRSSASGRPAWRARPLSSPMPAQRELVEHARRPGPARPAGRPAARRRAGPPSTGAAAGPRQQRPVRPDREREEGRDQQEEDERQRRRAAGRGQPQLAQDQARSCRAPPSRASARPSGWWRGGEDRAAAGPVRRHRRRQPRAARPRRGRWPARRAARAARRSRSPGPAPRACAGRWRASAPALRRGGPAPSPPSPAGVGAVQPAQKAERRAQRLPLVQRQMLVGERRARPRSTVPAAARSSPAATRIRLGLADAVRARRPAPRSPGVQRQVQPLEQQPAAAHAGDAAQREQAQPGLRPRCACMSASEKPKWWPTSWTMTWVISASSATPVSTHSSSSGPAVEVDHRRQLARQPSSISLADRAAGIEAGQLERILDAELRRAPRRRRIPRSCSTTPSRWRRKRSGSARDRRFGEPLDRRRVGRKV